MLAPALVKKVLDAALSLGADFAELFVEDTYQCELRVTDSKPSKALVGRLKGAGIRLFYSLEQVYVTTNDLTETGLIKAAMTAAKAKHQHSLLDVKRAATFSKTAFDEAHDYGTHPWEYDREKKFRHLMTMDASARERSSWVTQVEPFLVEKTQRVLIANSSGVWSEDERNYVRTGLNVSIEDQGVREAASSRTGTLGTSDWFETVDFEKLSYATVDRAKLLIHADYAPAGEMPVVISNGFGGVIFHEACGHGLETTSIAKNASVFCGKLGTRIADSCVTAIDDGTIANSWGSLNVDDEGMKTKKTVLIEDGVLKSYMVDDLGSRQTGFERTGSGRRQSYKFAPTSRMRNTFIAAGQNSVEDMIRDIDHGLYAKEMGGGSVSPGSGDYNFGVTEAWLIQDGRLLKPVKGATLIGRGIETLGRIKKVGRDFCLQDGMCESVSGNVPTSVGQPTLLISKILVGGRADASGS